MASSVVGLLVSGRGVAAARGEMLAVAWSVRRGPCVSPVSCR